MQPDIHFLIPGGQALPVQVALVKERRRGSPLLDPSQIKISLGPGHIVLQDPAAVCQHGGFIPGCRLTAVGTI